MIKNHCLAQAISDVGLFEFRRQIEYKAKWNGRKVIFVDTFFSSSKLCSCCGWKNSNPRKMRNSHLDWMARFQ